MALKYKVGDRVKIKSLDWYKENRNNINEVKCGVSVFVPAMTTHCGYIRTISKVFEIQKVYHILEDNDLYTWTDEMIEGLVKEECNYVQVDNIPDTTQTKISSACSHNGFYGYSDSDGNETSEWNLPEGYIFKDENGNVINATKIVLEKKKKEYPKTYEECCVDLGLKVCPKIKVSIGDTPTYREHIVETFIKLLACRDTYLKRYEIEMKLNSRWTPDFEDLNTTKFCITTSRDKVIKVESSVQNYVFAFPTEEMRDAFKKNFDNDLERCKELL